MCTRALTLCVLVVCAIAGFGVAQGPATDPKPSPSPSPTPSPAAQQDVPFHKQVDLTPLGRVAVHTEGRLKSFGSYANSQMQFVTGPRKINGQESDFTYLDMLIRPAAYEDADVIYIKNGEVRAQLAAELMRAAPNDAALAERMQGFMKSGLISEKLLSDPALEPLMQRLEGDLIRSAKQMDAIKGALAVKQPQFLLGSLRLIPPGDGKVDSPWISIGDIMLLGANPDTLPPQLRERIPPPLPGIDPALQQRVASDWRNLVIGWNAGDARAVNAAVASMSAALPQLKPDLYPERSRLEWESWYFRTGNMSWIWFIYMGAIIFLLLGLVYRWSASTYIGLAIFLAGFAFHTSAIGLRWYISGRWPNSNMFEAVTTAAWMGTALAVLGEVWFFRTRMRGLLALCGAMTGMVALMSAHFLPAELNPNISNMMPVLHDVWLYIHTNVVIFSYAIIFMAAVTAAVYLVMRIAGAPPVYAKVGGAGAAMSLAAGGGASGVSEAPGASSGRPRMADLAEVLDGVTMLLMELSFIMLFSGIVMGAIWADHSWGRPWGWDPKEVFALCTFLIFALLIHIRWKVRDKGLWTAVLTLVGAGVMLFNWIVINFVISGLHSYA